MISKWWVINIVMVMGVIFLCKDSTPPENTLVTEEVKASEPTSILGCKKNLFILDEIECTRASLAAPLSNDEQAYLSSLSIESLKAERYLDASIFMGYLKSNVFSNEEVAYLLDISSGAPAELNIALVQILSHLASAGEAFAVYERLLAWAEKELRQPVDYPSGAAHLRAFLIHHGCMRTAEVWKEITSDHSSNIHHGGSYSVIPVAKGDWDAVRKERVLLRKEKKVPKLQSDCPIYLSQNG
jgi:hypothetical protein